jgi:thiosulfate/3-mercaptopyruvate sulfurtransferase
MNATPGTGDAAPMDWQTLVEAEALAPHLGDPALRLVDARFTLGAADAAAGERAWRAGHLPGAGYADLDRDLSDHHKPAARGRHPLPDVADFLSVLVRLGITPEAQVVVYDHGDGAMAAARFWWLLRLLGHRRVAVLDGGFAAWTARGLPVETSAPAIAPGRYAGDFDRAQVASAEDVAAGLAAGTAVLLDARAPERFRGDVEPLDARAGHVPGARNRPWAANLADGRFLPRHALREQYEALLGDLPPTRAIVSCGSGVTACHDLLAMEHAGLHGARVFADSWSGWIADPSRPVATGD